MNGEMYQLCRLTIAAKSALFGFSDFEYEPPEYENKIGFTLLSEARRLIKRHTADNAYQWYSYCLKKGLRDIKLMLPADVKDRSVLGFINTVRGYILCYFKTGEITAFIPSWQYDPQLKKWDILYTERLMLIPYVKPYSEDNSDEFREVLIEIGDLAERIDCGDFAKIFEKALNILDGFEEPAARLALPKAAERNLPLFSAAAAADVFGAMGSWNDAPPCMAHEKGLDKEYEELSARLLKNIRLAILFSINEW